MFRIFIPHVLGIVGAILWIRIAIPFMQQRTMLGVGLSTFTYILLFLTLVGLTPSRWLHPAPTEAQDAEIAIVFNFGYEMDGDRMKPGEANQYLWEWIINNKPSQLRVILVQEGVWVAADEETLENLGIEMMRIHR